MELDRKPFFRNVLNSSHGMGRFRDQLKAGRQLQRFVAMRHPHRLPLGESVEQQRLGDDIDFRVAVLALVGRPHLAAERVHHELQPVTNAEHRYAQIEDAPVRGRGIFVVDRPGCSREHNAYGRAVLDLVERGRAGQHDGKNILFADAARDELGILRAKVEDDDGLGFHE
jgi:hypothetical protein